MEFYCEKKKKYIPAKRAKRKCIGVNLKKRQSICCSLKTILTSAEVIRYIPVLGGSLGEAAS